MYGFPRGALAEVPRTWNLLSGWGVPGTVMGSPGNPCFPTKSNPTNLHEQNKKLVQVKEEKNTAEAALKSVLEEQEAAEADFEEVMENLRDANDLVQQQYLAQDIWQGRFDELVSLVGSGQVVGEIISAVCN